MANWGKYEEIADIRKEYSNQKGSKEMGARWLLSIPPSAMPILEAVHPELKQGPKERAEFWKKFARSPASLPFRVSDKDLT